MAIQSPGAPATARIIDTTIWPTLDGCHLVPPPLAVDFYRAAAAVYAADMRVLRDSGYDRWTREMVLHLPVSDLAAWSGVHSQFVELLAYLTGDRWEVVFRAGSPGRPTPDGRATRRGQGVNAAGACLLSGGLDSFIGALDETAKGRRLVFVSHNAMGSARFSSPAQDAVRIPLVAAAAGPVTHLKLSVHPPHRATGAVGEPSQRSRSIMFIGLGVLVASALPPGSPLVVPENGFISLNVPLTFGRLGSLSTRTTHPHTLSLMRQVLEGLGLNVPLETPYRFLTKGQMLQQSATPSLLHANARETNSCARPNERSRLRGRDQNHCGYCVPCIIRRAAMRVVGLDDPKDYRYQVHRDRKALLTSSQRRQDLRAFEMALARARVRADITDVLRAGPLPVPPAEVARHVEVYRAGLDEVSTFLLGKPLW